MKKIFTNILIAAVALTMAAQGNRTKWGQEMLEAKHKMIIETV